MDKNGVVQGIGMKGAESMVGAAGSNSQCSSSWLMEQGGPASNGNSSGFEFHRWEPCSAVQAGNKMVAEWNAGRALLGSHRQYSLSGSKEAASGGINEDNSEFALQMVESVVAVEAQGMVNLGNKSKRGAEWMGAAPPGARGSTRQRSLSGSIETRGGILDELAALATGCGRKSVCLWWDDVNRPGYPDAAFKRDFHMSRSTFDTLWNMLEPSLRKEDTAARDAIPVPKRVAICIYCFATGANSSDLQRRFGIGSTKTIHKIMNDVTAAINDIVEPGHLSALWPRGADAMDDAAAKFQDFTGGLRGVIGAVYTTHLLINAPRDAASQYHCSRRLTERRNGKIVYSFALHAAVNADGAFTQLCFGRGNKSDEAIFSVSSSTSTEYAEEMVSQGKRLVGGAGYPLTDCTLVPYTHSNNLTPPQNKFNDKVALARGVALDAFRRLKARWAILQKRPEGKFDDSKFKSMLTACCVLHNFCERKGDEPGDEIKRFKLEDDEMVLDNPVRSPDAAEVRDAIAHNRFHDSTMAAK